MPDYRRLISYIYEYEGDEKGKNVGFVKLEARNGQCRIHVNIKQMYMGGNAVGVYLLGKSGEKTCLGNMFVRGGSGEFHAVVDVKNVEGTGNPLDMYYGLTVHEVKYTWRVYTTIWEDCERRPDEREEKKTESRNEENEEIRKAENETEQEKKKEEKKIQKIDETENEPAVSVGTDPEKQERWEEWETQENLNESESFETSKTDVGMSIMAQDILPGSAEVREKQPELEDPDVLKQLQEMEDSVADPERLWEELRKTYPKIQPFTYDSESEVLTIRPQDIGRLPRECWIYGNNSFLLHGYYNFRYIILVRLRQNDGKYRYLLGIPGHYYSSEKYMATMFGFPNFVLSKKQPPNDGRFGYWYTDIKMN